MKCSKVELLSCLFSLIASLGLAQNSPYKLEKMQAYNLDSANMLIGQAIERTKKVDSIRYLEYLQLRGQILQGTLPPQKAIDSLLDLDLSEKLRLNLLNLKGSVLYYSGEIEEALAFYALLYRSSKKARFDEMSRKALSNLSAIYSRIGVADSALHYAMLSLDADKAAKDTSGFSFAYNYIGLAYQELNLYDKSIEFLKQGLLYEPTALTRANILYNIGVSYSFNGDYDSSQSYLHKAHAYYLASDYKAGLVKSNNVMGSNMAAKGQLELAESYYTNSLKISRQIADSMGIATVKHELAKLFIIKKEFRKALSLALAAQSFNERNHLHAYSKNTTRMLSLAYAGLGKMDSALHYSAISDTLVKHINQKKYLQDLSEAESKLNLAEKELELVERQQTITNLQNKQLRYSIIGLVILTLFIIGFLVYRADQRKKHHRAIMAQKQESLNKEILAAENERSRISKDLHDGIGQQISALSLNLQFLKRSKSDDELRNGLKTISQQLKQSAEDVRDISHQMMPRILVEKGLVDAADLLLRQSFKNSDVEYDFSVEPQSFSIDKKLEISLYRILQELINNIVKHSGANQVQVKLSKHNNSVQLTVRDNGTGFSSSHRSGHGMQNIQSRIDMFKGRFKIENLDGTYASITIPLS